MKTGLQQQRVVVTPIQTSILLKKKKRKRERDKELTLSGDQASSVSRLFLERVTGPQRTYPPRSLSSNIIRMIKNPLSSDFFHLLHF